MNTVNDDADGVQMWYSGGRDVSGGGHVGGNWAGSAGISLGRMWPGQQGFHGGHAAS